MTELAATWSGSSERAAGWLRHVRRAHDVAHGAWRPSGRPPDDLVAVMALLGVAGPANCALRALTRTSAGERLRWRPLVRHAAGRIAWGFRALLNVPEVIALVRSLRGVDGAAHPETPYWRQVLEYAGGGNLQSVLDEYFHLRRDDLRHSSEAEDPEALYGVAAEVSEVIGMSGTGPSLDWIAPGRRGGVQIDKQRARARFARRFGDEQGEEEGLRRDLVRSAFNSPFWPFVLVTTSIGQEGLDFHKYCHAVHHWNLPANPVDLEQREGRVHRYKGHAVRKNVARAACERGVDLRSRADPWQAAFEAAEAASDDPTGIQPYWVFVLPGGAVIERHAPTLPFSREAALLPRLRASLAVYRLAFGQPRQEDLLEHLRSTVPEADLGRYVEELRIDLEPPDPDKA